MTCGSLIKTYPGPGKGWGYPHSQEDVIEPEQRSRWLPFRDPSMAMQVTGLSGQNRSGSSWQSVFGMETAEEKARNENFKF